MKIFVKFLLGLMVCLLVVSCTDSKQLPTKTVVKDDKIYQVVDYSSGIINYRNGVYYFDYNLEDFAKSLSQFIEEHPELRFVSFTGIGANNHDYDKGYFVVFENRE